MPAAVAFDFNGTLSDDEPLLAQLYADLFGELGHPLTEAEYFEQLAGHTDEEMFERWLGRSDADLIEERVDRYCVLASDGRTVRPETREAVAFAAAQVPVAVVSAALRREIDAVVDGAGLRPHLSLVVSQDDVRRGKPDPECYLTAADRLGIPAGELLVFEDTDVGVAAAKAAGCFVAALTRTIGADRLRAADALVEQLDVATLERFLCS
ncbi:MAG TPA: HAD family phosphatase [Acidimicrobiales bacterium]|nr:HAD family phosphatase [Acidimicrobiales bacterium]